MNASAEPIEDGSGHLPPGDDVRAAEYVLGVLDADERRQVQSRLAGDPAFARLVEAWEERFASWLLQAPAVAPSDHVWPRIRTRLGWPAVENGRNAGLWNNPAFWRGAAALTAVAAAAVVAIGLNLRGPPETAPAPVAVQPVPLPGESAARPVAVLARDDGATAWIAAIDAAAGRISMAPVPSPADARGRVNELWLIPAGRAPISLGFVSNEKAHTIEVPAAVRGALAVGATLAVTLEPEAGMPHAAPTGPIVAKGGIARI